LLLSTNYVFALKDDPEDSEELDVMITQEAEGKLFGIWTTMVKVTYEGKAAFAFVDEAGVLKQLPPNPRLIKMADCGPGEALFGTGILWVPEK
jgi:hypothetical protein